ncbi:MAG: histidinol dehydrogenase [Armatimonadota bacterium]|nr:histidinol dehydrogenase [Armatimonadota bacterium]
MGGAGRDRAQLNALTTGARRCVALSDLVTIVDGRADLPVCLRELSDRRHRRQPAHIERSAREIVERVVAEGDAAVVEYTRRFDCPTFDASQLSVQPQTIQTAYDEVASDWVRAYRRARENILSFHERQLPGSWLEEFDGMLLGERLRPVASVGVHVPGFSVPLFATVAMSVEPARAAGVERVVIATPPRKDGSIDPLVLVACAESGVDEIYRMGGAQAVAAVAYGTETVAAVDMVVGPGNPYTMAAKRMVFGQVGIDSLAGPSESMIIADGQADPAWVAADLLCQAEHTGDNTVVLATESESLADAVEAAAHSQIEKLQRADLIRQSLAEYGMIALVEGMEAACELCNELAPEHLQLMVAEPLALLELIHNAGAIFVGELATVPLGDYAAGPSHVLPTGGSARFSSGLSVRDFLRGSSLIYAAERGFTRLAQDVELLAEAEGLDAHAAAVRIRRRAGFGPQDREES